MCVCVCVCVWGGGSCLGEDDLVQKACFRSEADELLNFPDRPAWTLPQLAVLVNAEATVLTEGPLWRPLSHSQPTEPCVFKTAPVKDTNGSVLKTLEDTFLNAFTYSCSVFPSSDCLSFPREEINLWLWGWERMCYSSSAGGGEEWMYNLSGTQSGLSHGLPLCSEAVWPALVSSSNSRYSSLPLSGAHCVSVSPLSRPPWMSCCQSACPPDLSRVTRLYHPPVSGILSFLFSSCAEPVFAASR